MAESYQKKKAYTKVLKGSMQKGGLISTEGHQLSSAFQIH